MGCFGSLEVVLPEREEAKDLPGGGGFACRDLGVR